MCSIRSPRLAWLERRLPIPAEAALLGLVLCAWQAARIPLEGNVPQALHNAHRYLALQHTLGLTGLQNAVISLVHHRVIRPAARWSYANFHIFAIFTFMIAVRCAAPDRYPRLRTAFVLLHLPALLAIGLFPLGSPYWLPHLPAWAGAPPMLNGGANADLRNLTGTFASEHFGYALLIAAGAVWAARGRPVAWLTALYPIWIFIVIVGTGRHYPLDAVVGALCVLFGAIASGPLHRRAEAGGGAPSISPESRLRVLALALAFGLFAGWVNAAVSGDQLHLTHPSPISFASLAAAGIAAALARFARRRPPPDDAGWREGLAAPLPSIRSQRPRRDASSP